MTQEESLFSDFYYDGNEEDEALSSFIEEIELRPEPPQELPAEEGEQVRFFNFGEMTSITTPEEEPETQERYKFGPEEDKVGELNDRLRRIEEMRDIIPPGPPIVEFWE